MREREPMNLGVRFCVEFVKNSAIILGAIYLLWFLLGMPE